MSPEEDIRRVMAMYVHTHDTHDVEGMLELYSEDGLLVGSAGPLKGRAAICAYHAARRDRAVSDVRERLLCGNSVIKVDGDRAEALTDVVGFRKEADGPWTVAFFAQYLDKFVSIDGNWLYTEKRVIYV
jgi:ketosteroid isomerase-like protein